MEKGKVIKTVVVGFREHDLREVTHKVMDIRNDLESLHGLVGGYIEIPYISRKLAEKGIDMIINEEGKLLDLKTTILIVNDRRVLDDIRGTVIFASHNDDGETVSLTQEQIDYLEEVFSRVVVYDSSIVYTIEF